MCALAKKKTISILILLLKLMTNILKYCFSGEGVLLDSIIDIHCGTGEERADQNWITVDVSGGTVKIFQFAKVINEWPLNGKIIETGVSIWSFDLRMVCVKTILG